MLYCLLECHEAVTLKHEEVFFIPDAYWVIIIHNPYKGVIGV
jgi:hypothetical protein